MYSIDKDAIGLLWKSIERHGYLKFPSLGESMFPFITEGNIGTFVLVDVKSVGLGDVLLFVSQDNCLVAHRVILIKKQRNSTSFLLKGDTNLLSDGWIQESQVLGKLENIQKVNHQVSTDSFWSRSWARLILFVPFVTKVLRVWLAWIHRWQRVKVSQPYQVLEKIIFQRVR